MATYLITGANRGIGLELVRQLAQLDAQTVSQVVALTRSKSQPLDEVVAASSGRILPVHCEVTSQKSVEAAVEEVRGKLPNGLDVLINNVGVMPFYPEGIRTMPADALIDTFKTNVASVHLVSAGLIPLLEAGKLKKIINTSTSVGSITQALKFARSPAPSYKLTKAAVNMLSVQYALEYGPKGFTVLAISPGWLKTDLGSQNADLEVETGVRAVIDLILKSNPDQNGKFLNIHVPGWESAPGLNQYDGKELPW